MKKYKGLVILQYQSLAYAKPKTVGQTIRISGVTHNDIGILISIIKTAQKPNKSSFIESFILILRRSF